MKINTINIFWLIMGVILGFTLSSLKLTYPGTSKIVLNIAKSNPTPQNLALAPTSYITPIPVIVPNTYLSDAVKKAKELGYTVFVSDDTNNSFNMFHFNVLIGMCSGSVDGYCKAALFFYDGKYVGSDVPLGSESSQIGETWRDDNIIAINYFLYRKDDPMCCQTGGATTVRFKWDGSKVATLDNIPAIDSNALLSR